MINLTKFKRSVAVLQSELSLHHCIILTSILYRVQTLTSDNTEESENTPESPYLGEIKHMRKQCVPGISPFFSHTGDEATPTPFVFSYVCVSFIKDGLTSMTIGWSCESRITSTPSNWKQFWQSYPPKNS